jgi:hypothetical protein
MSRWMCGVTRMERIRNEYIRGKLKIVPVTVKMRRLDCVKDDMRIKGDSMEMTIDRRVNMLCRPHLVGYGYDTMMMYVEIETFTLIVMKNEMNHGEVNF